MAELELARTTSTVDSVIRDLDELRRAGARRRHPLVVPIIAVLLAICTATALLFIWPKRDAPAHADAIVVFNGKGARRATGIALARRGLAPILVFSEADPPREPACRLRLSGIQVLCFRPSPSSTQGESQEVARLAAARGWHRILVIVSRPQASRLRVRLRRCYAGAFMVQTVPVGLRALPWFVAYEWGAMVKAMVWQRQCRG